MTNSEVCVLVGPPGLGLHEGGALPQVVRPQLLLEGLVRCLACERSNSEVV